MGKKRRLRDKRNRRKRNRLKTAERLSDPGIPYIGPSKWRAKKISFFVRRQCICTFTRPEGPPIKREGRLIDAGDRFSRSQDE